MSYQQIFFLVEGPDDSRFVDGVIEPVLSFSSRDVKTYEYSVKPDEDVNKFIEHFSDVDFRDYYLMVDEDKAEEVKTKFDSLDQNRMLVVVKEIESWYLAGLTESDSENIGVSYRSNTDSITKEDFNQIIPENYDERTIFMIDLLDCFQISEGRESNESFRESSDEIPLNSD